MRTLYVGNTRHFKGGCDDGAHCDNRVQLHENTSNMGAHDDRPADAAEQVWQVVVMIPRGKVATYGQVALLAGLPGGARRVGRFLSRLPAGTRIPWHRVVNASGGISLPAGSSGQRRQRTRLRAEGIAFSKAGRISLGRFGWQP
jgi:methylated-DNA-protein-cysteine methyltransferase-like protein